MTDRNTVLVDIDGTLSIVGDRLKHYPEDRNLFQSRCDEDEPHPDMCQLVYALARSYNIVFLTGRKEFVREKTVAWIEKEFGTMMPWLLLMCPDEEHRSDGIVKPELAQKAGIKLDEIAFVLEDRDSVVAAWRALGVRVLQVAPGDF